MDEIARLLDAARSGSADAFNQLVDGQSARAFQVAARHGGQPAVAADDCARAFRAAYSAIGRFDGPADHWPTWLLGHVVAAEQDRAGAVDAPATPRRRPAAGELPAEYAASDDLAALLRWALARLPSAARWLLVLDAAGLDYADIGATLRLDPATVRVRLAQARVELAGALTGEGAAPAAGAAGAGGHPSLADLSAVLDQAIPGPRAAQVAAHVSGCPRCRDRQATLGWSRAYTQALPPVPVPPLASFHVAAVPPETRGKSREMWALAAAVVCLIMAALVWLGTRPTPVPSAAPTDVPAAESAPAAATPDPNAPAGRATPTQAGYPRPLGTALASDLARLAARAALAQTAAAGGTVTALPPGPTQTAFAVALAATARAGPRGPGEAVATGGPPPGTAASNVAPTAAATAGTNAAAPVASARPAPEWLPLVAVALLCLGLGLWLVARRR